MRPTLDIDLLRTFHAIARLGKFRAAAAFVNRSPAAVSVHIQRLEQLAGGRLLERDNQSVALTPLGNRLLASTLVLLNAHDDILRELQGAPLSGHIKLGLPDEYASHVIRHILPRFADSFPAVELEVLPPPAKRWRNKLAVIGCILRWWFNPRGDSARHRLR